MQRSLGQGKGKLDYMSGLYFVSTVVLTVNSRVRFFQKNF